MESKELYKRLCFAIYTLHYWRHKKKETGIAVTPDKML